MQIFTVVNRFNLVWFCFVVERNSSERCDSSQCNTENAWPKQTPTHTVVQSRCIQHARSHRVVSFYLTFHSYYPYRRSISIAFSTYTCTAFHARHAYPWHSIQHIHSILHYAYTYTKPKLTNRTVRRNEEFHTKRERE